MISKQWLLNSFFLSSKTFYKHDKLVNFNNPPFTESHFKAALEITNHILHPDRLSASLQYDNVSWDPSCYLVPVFVQIHVDFLIQLLQSVTIVQLISLPIQMRSPLPAMRPYVAGTGSEATESRPQEVSPCRRYRYNCCLSQHRHTQKHTPRLRDIDDVLFFIRNQKTDTQILLPLM